MGLVNLSDYKNTILNMILADQDLCKYLYYDVDDPLSESDIVDTSDLSNKENPDRRIFAIPFNADIHQTQRTTLHIEIEQPDSILEPFYKEVNVNFIILSHNHLWELYTADNSVLLRPDMIVSKLTELFHRTESIGVGKSLNSKLHNIYLNEEVFGYKIEFMNIDFAENN